MMIKRTFLSLLFATLVYGVPLFGAGSTTPELNAVVTNAIAQLTVKHRAALAD
jgi:hypothetical protein